MEALTHYHKVDTFLWFYVSGILRRLIVRAVEDSPLGCGASLSLPEADALLQFLDEMQFAYMHPRSTSRRVSLAARDFMSRENRSANP